MRERKREREYVLNSSFPSFPNAWKEESWGYVSVEPRSFWILKFRARRGDLCPVEKVRIRKCKWRSISKKGFTEIETWERRAFKLKPKNIIRIIKILWIWFIIYRYLLFSSLNLGNEKEETLTTYRSMTIRLTIGIFHIAPFVFSLSVLSFFILLYLPILCLLKSK